jgi:hypothetical protein
MYDGKIEDYTFPSYVSLSDAYVVETLQSIVVRIGAFHVASLSLSLVATFDVVIVSRFF